MNSNHQHLTALRKRAEALLDANADTVEAMSSKDICELLHELNVHKIELEMQNQELRNTQLALETSRNKYFTLYEFSPVGYFNLAENGLILEVNLAGAKLLGIEKGKLFKRGFLRFIAPAFQQSFFLHKQRALKTKVKQTVELELIKNDGAHFFVQMESISIDKDVANHYQLLTSVLDITERKQAQKELEMHVEKRTQELRKTNQSLKKESAIRLQAEQRIQEHQKELAHVSRLNIIGEMVSGIAHELNQPLAAIMHYAGGCMERLRGKKRNQDILNAMKRVTVQTERAGKIIHRLKDFSKKNVSQKIFIDVNKIIHETLEFVNYELQNAQIELQLQLSKKPLFISAIKIQLEQVLINIIQNAIEAMREIVNNSSRRLTIQTCQCTMQLVNIIISDTGCGIPSPLITRIFDPFFTTKTNGIGLGLSISQTIIQAHGGQILLSADIKKGACFHIKLPAGKKAHAK